MKGSTVVLCAVEGVRSDTEFENHSSSSMQMI